MSLNQAQPPEFVGCSFTNCSSVGNGGAIYLSGATTDVKIVNTSFTDCVSSNGTAGAVYVSMSDGETGDPLNTGFRNVARYSFFETGTASVPANRHNVVADDPRFIGGTFVPTPGSPIRRSGLVETWMEDATDLNGAPRLNDNGTVAMGCYRYDSPGFLLLVK